MVARVIDVILVVPLPPIALLIFVSIVFVIIKVFILPLVALLTILPMVLETTRRALTPTQNVLNLFAILCIWIFSLLLLLLEPFKSLGVHDLLSLYAQGSTLLLVRSACSAVR